MARKLRLEYPGACYHVINRGNYRADVFRTERTKAAFEACLFEACVKSGWRLHAFVIMRNHYHLALETPRGNLVAGMQWLQATFAGRFNRLRGERGHLFQGRYKALMVEPGTAFGRVCHYLHLNPVRAGIISSVALGGYRFSSYWYLARPKARPRFFQLDTALREAGLLADTPAGWKAYARYLDWLAATGMAGQAKAYARMSRGWVLGSAEFRMALIKDHQLLAESRAWEAGGAQEVREEQCRQALDTGLRACGKTASDLARDPKTAPWKVALAAELKRTTLARNAWLAHHLNMGRPGAVSSHVSKYRRDKARAKGTAIY
jgi:REP element-mobilizing transposase RayT